MVSEASSAPDPTAKCPLSSKGVVAQHPLARIFVELAQGECNVSFKQKLDTYMKTQLAGLNIANVC
eukprot:6205774-Pleurochrysis_carterae.AAC.8